MVPLQAEKQVSVSRHEDLHQGQRHTELLLDDLKNLLLVELLGQTLNSGQSLTTIALCETRRLAWYPF
jgi:hypothetical protein